MNKVLDLFRVVVKDRFEREAHLICERLFSVERSDDEPDGVF